jgi:1,2-diacylglycerol 3-alpha-glucosyltransferase
VKYPENILPLRTLPLPSFLQNKIDDVRAPLFFKNSIFDFFIKNNIEILHSHDTAWMGSSCVEIAKALKIPHVHTYHVYMEEYNKSIQPFGYRMYLRALTRKVCNNSDAVIALSSKVKKYLENIGVTSKIQVILNPPDIDHLRKDPGNGELMKKYSISKNDFVFITFGRVIRSKNLDLGIKSLSKLLKKHSNIKYIIAGEGDDLERMKKLVRHLKIEKQVIFTGRYQRDELINIAGLADAFLITSYSEVQGITILEAMACSLPVVCVDDEAFKDIVKDGYNGLICSKDGIMNAVERIFSDTSLREVLSKGAFETSEKIRGKNISLEYIKLYKEVLGR